MSAVTRAAYPDVLGTLVLVVTFGVHYRGGLVLAQAVLWTELLTGLIKELVALPRPSDVDSRVGLMIEGERNETRFTAAGGAGFWDLPDAGATAAVRLSPDPTFGFPSSAVSTATAFWGGAAMASRAPRLLGGAAAIITLTAVSRLYLGRHFLADVAGGAGLGAAVLLTLRRSAVQPLWRFRSPVWPPILALVPLLALLTIPHIDPGAAGGLTGLYAAKLLAEARGVPLDRATLGRKIARVLLAVGIYVVVAVMMGFLLRTVAVEADPAWADYVATATTVFAVFWGGMRTAERLRLFRRAR